jgi:hypothetical protein
VGTKVKCPLAMIVQVGLFIFIIFVMKTSLFINFVIFQGRKYN